MSFKDFFKAYPKDEKPKPTLKEIYEAKELGNLTKEYQTTHRLGMHKLRCLKAIIKYNQDLNTDPEDNWIDIGDASYLFTGQQFISFVTMANRNEKRAEQIRQRIKDHPSLERLVTEKLGNTLSFTLWDEFEYNISIRVNKEMPEPIQPEEDAI